MKLQHVLEYILFRLTAGILALLPLEIVQRLGGLLGELVYSPFGYRRRVTLDNLRHAFPERSMTELDVIARGAFRNVGIAFFELLWLPRMSEQRLSQLMHFEHPESVREVYSRGMGVLLLTAHFGNWELLAQGLPVCNGIPVNVIAKTQSNALVDRHINRLRAQFGNKVVPMDLAVREVIRALRAGEAVGVIADQSAPKENIAVDFFGRSVPTHEGPALFCLRMEAPIVLMFAVRQADGSYRVTFEELETKDFVGYSEQNVVELTRRHVHRTEEIIRQYPDQWMWMHKRWKHVPDVEHRTDLLKEA